MNLDLANALITAALDYRRAQEMKPLTIAVIDAGGHLVALQREDGTSTLRAEIAQGKAKGAVAMGLGSRALYNRAQEQPYFINAMNALNAGNLVPVPGGVLIRRDGALIGAIGITGDSSDNDEACAVAAIESQGLVAETG
ncbi:heme-binding protein [Cognatishimia sp. F0-27]|uniref:GlcG/HbpS family heme-binding protein n=1 Tax=Cognatishimia sp. F0-27 TaxID=2816855 RepID=UPI001D0C5D2A|nr:heme-binding protein [Cognatishimia sp. F0-27]MCC1494616.1 heme-binding protein [Cognatishimia sp. F0-27]